MFKLCVCAFAVVTAACSKTSTKYCELHPDDEANCGPPDVDAPTACTTDDECSPDVCDIGGTGTCVECTETKDAACTGAMPACIDNTCQPCTAHTQCDSAACLPDGACADTDDVAYVQMGGSGTACTQAMPCATLDDAVKTNKPIAKIAAGLVKDDQVTTIDGKTVTILADPGAKLDRDGDGAILVVRSTNADVSIFDLEITGGTGPSDPAIQLQPNGGTPKLTMTRVTVSSNQGGGISSSGGSLTVSQSTVFSNQGGGISVSGVGATFDITNNFIFRNGDQDNSAFGGLNLGITAAGSNRLEFNTVVDNRAAINSGGVICNVAAFAGANNIIARNSLAGSTTAVNAQTSGACTYPSSKVQNDITGLAFIDPEAPAPFDYHLAPGSTAIDQGTTASTIVIDVDGDARPQGAADQGADELAP